MSEEVSLKKAHLAALETFMTSPAYKGYLAACEYDIKGLEEAIVMVEPVDRKDEIENFKLRGELRCMRAMSKTFEDARVCLKKRIDELVERELENATNTKV